MKITLISSLKSKLILSLSVFIIAASVITTTTVYFYMYETIKEDRMYDLGQVAHNRHQLLVNELYNLNRNAEGRLAQIFKMCFASINEGLGQDECIHMRLDAHLKIEPALGVLLYSKSEQKLWTAGKISIGEVENLQFKPGQLAHFSARGQKNTGRPFYIKVEDRNANFQLFAKFPIQEIEKLFISNEEVGKTGETFLADEKGFFITPPRYDSHGHIGLETHISVRPMEVCLQSKNTQLLDYDYRGVQIIHGFRYVPEIGGGCIMAHMDQSEAFAFVNSLKFKIFGACILFIFVSIGLIILFSHYIINPIKYLAEVAHNISMGNYKLKSNIHRNDEIGVLSDAFNQMTSSLLQLENRFKLAVENIHDYAIIMLDTKGIVTNWNRGGEKIFGYHEAEIVGRHYSCFFAKEDQVNDHPETNLRVAMAQRSIEEEGERVRKNGEKFIATVSVTPIFDENQVHYGFIKIIQDISEKRKLERSELEAQRASLQKTSFLACMSHEIRTPLNSIIGVTELLMEKNLPVEDKGLLGIAHAAGETLLTVINDTLDLSRIEAGEMPLEQVPFYLSEQLQICLSMMEIRAKEKKIRLNLNMEDNLGDRYVGDPTRIRQIIINLVGNAIKFSEQGKVSIVVMRLNSGAKTSDIEALQFAVSDEGIGIPESQRELIFERFKQADETVTRRFGGTGLGLSISKRLVEMMRGKIWVESIVGQGSTFYFTVHLKKDFECLANRDKTNLTALKTECNEGYRYDRRLKILLADDSDDNRFIFKGFLKNCPFDIDNAINGQMAVEMFKSGHYDIVFMDVQMPILDGYSATKIIRQWEKANGKRRTPIVAFTANALDEDLRMSIAAGCNDHMSKPLRKEKLLKLIDSFLGLRTVSHTEGKSTVDLHP